MRQLIAMAALWAGLLVLMSLCMRSATAAPALNNSSGQPGAFPACAELAVQGLVRFPIGRVCAWPKQPPSARQDHIQLLGEASGTFPAVLLSAASNSTLAAPSVPGASAAGLTLSIKRLMLLNVTVAPLANATHSPKLLPLGLFAQPVTNLTLVDVRFSVPPDIFQQYLSFFSKFLLAVKTKSDGGVGMHTDGTSFLNIPSWSDAYTELSTVTILTGPCIIPSANYSQPIQAVLNRMGDVPGCNVRSANNQTLIPILQRDATINTTQPLLVRLVSNVTLGANLERPIVFGRPVLILGASSAPVSVDLQMVVNQFNVTRCNAQLSWQAVVLENLAPGDATSAAIAPPYSITVTTNVWAVYCNRSRDMCLPLTNVTLVIPSADEISYLTFMSTMYNSPSPALQELAGFYRTDLKMTAFDIVQGPTSDSIKVLRLVTNTWNLWYCIEQTRPVFAPQLPAPRQVFNQLQYKTGVLVQSIQDCSSLQGTQTFAPNRVQVWQLAGNISLSRASCTPVKVIGATTLIGDVVAANQPPAADTVTSMRQYPLTPAAAAAPPPASANQSQLPSPAELIPDPASALAGRVYSLGFQYVPGLITIPADAPDRYFQVRNITLWQLPQAHTQAGSASLAGAAGGSRRRLVQAGAPAAGAGGAVSLPDMMPTGVFTIMLWPFNRSDAGAPLTVADAQLMLPQPEWELIAQGANSRNFAIDLQDSSALIFSKVSLSAPGVLTVGSFQGPGITGSNLRLLPDPAAVAAMPGGHLWPATASGAIAGLVAESSGQQHSAGLPAGARAAIGAGAGVLGALVAAAVMLLLLRRHRRKARLDKGLKQWAGVRNARSTGGAGAAAPVLPAHAPAAAPAKALAALRRSSSDSAAILQDQQQAVLSNAEPGQPVVVAAAGGVASHSQGSGSSSRGVDRGGAPVADSLSEPLPCVAMSGSMAGVSCSRSVGETPASVVASTLSPVEGSPRLLSGTDELELAIAQGLQQWNNAVSMHTMLLMQQRLQASSMRCLQRPMGSASTTCSSSTRALSLQAGRQSAVSDTTTAAGGAAPGSRPGSSNDQRSPSEELRLFEVIGTGSFGAVHLGSWRGKQVAVKVMHLPLQAFSPELGAHPGALQQGQQQQGQAGRQQHMRQQNSRPHMAIMEAVLSTNLHHPNVVQVYTYMLDALMANGPWAGSSSGGGEHRHRVSAAEEQQEQGAALPGGQAGEAAAGGAGAAVMGEKQGTITGWRLQLVMEHCDQGTLRDQLDRRLLPHLPGSTLLHPAVAVALSHDIAAAMLHLHKEGIVHGDLKAGNVLLQASTGISRAAVSMDQQQKLLRVWTEAGCLPLVAKVADFGLSLPLGHQDTHATLHARGTPTHMSPELFTSGHIGKSSDVYAYGILLYEVVTGMRAYAGVPTPLLPHRVAVEGLRPSWPESVPADLVRLAEACWVEKPQHRPDFQSILAALEAIDVSGAAAAASAAGQQAILQVPTTAALAAADAADAAAVAAAAAAAGRPPRPLPPLPGRATPQQHHQHHHQQQQKPLGVRSLRQPSHTAGGPAAGTPGPAVKAKDLEWSEVSHGGGCQE